MDFDDHDKHYALLYYPSNALIVGSAEEWSFFRNRWQRKSDLRRVRRIYEDFRRRCGVCPCRALFAFNVLDATVYNDDRLSNLPICDENRAITKFAFTNEYQLTTAFFAKRADETNRNANVISLRVRLPELETMCEFRDESSLSSTAVAATAAAAANRRAASRPSTTKNERKLEKIEPTLRKALQIADGLSKDVERLKRIARDGGSGVVDGDDNATAKCLYEVLMKRARSKYLRLDYFYRFRIILSDLDMYLPKMTKNKKFKAKRDALRNRISRDCLEYWGIRKQRESSKNNANVGGDGDDDDNNNEDDILDGKLLPVNDDPSHPWFGMTGRCKHEGGIEIVHAQTRSGDEMISSLSFCKLCRRRVHQSRFDRRS